MLRPSQTLLKQMPALNKFIVHPPLPLNGRQSMQLLNNLTASFRKSLDLEHGPDVRPEPRIDFTSKPKSRRHSTSDLSRRPTDKHMHSVLTNPLFAGPSASPGNPNAPKNPMEVFDRAVAKGMMNTQAAHACLAAKMSEIILSGTVDVNGAMRSSGAGLKILKWLVSSGTVHDTEFWIHDRLLKKLTRFLVAEDLQQVVWTWIERGFDDYAHRIEERKLRTPPYPGARLLVHLATAEAQASYSLDAAYNCLSRAAEYLTSRNVTQPGMRRLLGRTARVLFQDTISLKFYPVASGPAFDSFLRLAPDLLNGKKTYVSAWLSLLHPDRPNADQALIYFTELDADKLRLADPGSMFENDNISLGLNSARFLLQQDNRLADAQWLMKYLQVHYPAELGLVRGRRSKKTEAEQARAEAVSLQLLQSLGFA
jgi:hypothetical protein